MNNKRIEFLKNLSWSFLTEYGIILTNWMQLMNCNDPETSIESYLDVIHHKTATLFEAASRLGAIINDADEAVESAMAKFGLHLGNAFQLIDDALDYSADAEQLGKNVGDDLAEGKPTLPLILAMQLGSASQRDMINKAIVEGGTEYLTEITTIIRETGALEKTIQQAEQEVKLAESSLQLLPASAYKDALLALANFSKVKRIRASNKPSRTPNQRGVFKTPSSLCTIKQDKDGSRPSRL